MAEQEEKKNIKVVDLTATADPRPELKFYKVFNLTYTAKNGEIREGTFTCKRLTLNELTQMGMRVAQREGGLANVPQYAHNLNVMMAHLELALVDPKPTWWKPAELYDEDLLEAVFEEVGKFENSFR